MNNQEIITDVKVWATGQMNLMRTRNDALVLAEYAAHKRKKGIAHDIIKNRDACLQTLSEVRGSAKLHIIDETAREASISALPKDYQAVLRVAWEHEGELFPRQRIDAVTTGKYSVQGCHQKIAEANLGMMCSVSDAQCLFISPSRSDVNMNVLQSLYPKSGQAAVLKITRLRLFLLLNNARPESVCQVTLEDSLELTRDKFRPWITGAVESLNKIGKEEFQFVVQGMEGKKYRMLTRAEIPRELMQILHEKKINLSAEETDVLRFILSHTGTQVPQEECMIVAGIENTDAGKRRLKGFMNQFQKLASTLHCTLVVDGEKTCTLDAEEGEKTPLWLQDLQPQAEECSDTLSSLGNLLTQYPGLTIDDFHQYLNRKRKSGSSEIRKDWLQWAMTDEEACDPAIMTRLRKLLVNAAEEKRVATQRSQKVKSFKDEPPTIETTVACSDTFYEKLTKSGLNVQQLCALLDGAREMHIEGHKVTQFLANQRKLPKNIVDAFLSIISEQIERKGEVRKKRSKNPHKK